MLINNWQLNTAMSSLTNIKTGETRRLGEYQMKLLLALIEAPDTVLSRSYLTNKAWCNRVVGSNSLPVAINAIRQAIEDNGEIIKTIPKHGYILDSSYIQMQTTTAVVEQSPEPERSREIIVSIDNTTFLIGDRETIIPLVMASSFKNLVLH